MMTFTDGRRTVYTAQIVDCRWTNKARRQWSGRSVADTGAKIEERDGELHSAAARLKCDELSRAEASRLGLPAGPDVFPFAECP